MPTTARYRTWGVEQRVGVGGGEWRGEGEEGVAVCVRACVGVCGV
jgi:hypothetical protein